MPCLIGERTVQGNDIAAFEQFIKCDILDPAVFCRELIIGDDAHTESAADINEDPSYLSCADNADCFSMKIKAGQPVKGEVGLSGAVICFVDPADRREKKRCGMFSHSIGRISGYMDNVDFSVCSLQINVVVSCAAQGYHFDSEFVQFVYNCFVYGIIDKHTYYITAFGQISGDLIQFCFNKLEFDVVQIAVVFE